MSIFDDVSAHMKDAMKSGDKARLAGLRNIRAAFIEAIKVDGSATLADEAAETILRRLAKQRRESIDAYEAGGRTDLVAEEKAELVVIEAYLPAQADEATVRGWVSEAIAASGATSVKEMGKVMAALMGAHKGEVDGKVANRIIRELLPAG
ncbi:MAG: GatB/YqeY domain-containing protein [Myxococcales bacterium]|nr:GatB/YqeY domain-containing protein [Myxococcales bacterium]